MLENECPNECMFVSESGLDPAEWGAKLEDRFYNNHSFKVFKKKRLKMRQHSLNLKIILVPSNVVFILLKTGHSNTRKLHFTKNKYKVCE